MMKRKKDVMRVALALCAGGVGLTPAEAQDTADSLAVARVVEQYVVGWRTADHELLADVFATEEGVLLWPSGEAGEEALNGMTFAEILGREPRPNASYGEEWRILELDVVDGALAMAKVEISRTGGSYIDYLLLYRLAPGWRIVTKTFVSR